MTTPLKNNEDKIAADVMMDSLVNLLLERLHTERVIDTSQEALAKKTSCVLHTQTLEDIKKAVGELALQVKHIDTAIRGNGKPGLKAQVMAAEANLQALKEDLIEHIDIYKEDITKNTLAYRWKVGIVITFIIALGGGILSYFKDSDDLHRTDVKIENTQKLLMELIKQGGLHHEEKPTL